VQLQDYMGQQDSAARMAKQNTQSKAALRTVLRADLKRISETARGMEFDSPGLAARFKLPPMTDQRLVAAARAFLTDAEPLKADFIKNEMPADFLDQLRRHLADFEAAVEAQSRGTERRVSASAGISDVLQRAVRAVQQLNPIVRNKLANDPAALAAWDSARHIESAPKHAKKPANTPA